MRIEIGNNDYTQYVDNLQGLIISLEKDDTGLADVLFTQSLKVNGILHKLIEDTFFIDVCEGRKKKLQGKIYLECGFDFKFELSPDLVSYCQDGCSEITIKVSDQRTDAIECLKKQISFWSNPGFKDYLLKNGRLFKIAYCADAGIVLRMILTFVGVFGIISDILQAICKIIEIFGDVSFCRALDKFDYWLIGCAKYHNAILLRDIFEYNAKLCGLAFDSNLIQRHETYKNIAIESAIGGDGFHFEDCDDSDKQFDEKSQEIRNILQIAARIIPVFNGYVRITKDKFIFDHISRRDNELKNLLDIDIERSRGNIEDCPIFTIDGEKLCAYIRIDYTQDSTDFQGNRMINDYNEIVEWNPNNINPNNKGECRVEIKFAPSRFTHDITLKDSFWNVELANMRENGGIGFISGKCSFKHAQVLSEGQFSESKLIILNEDKKINCGSCSYVTSVFVPIGTARGILNSSTVYDYNRPLKGSELYKKFHYYDDPNGDNVRLIIVDELIWKPSDFCNAISVIFAEGLNVGIKSIYGTGIPTKIEINNDSCEIKFTEIKFKCSKK